MSEAPRFLRHQGRTQEINSALQTGMSLIDLYRTAPEDIRVMLPFIQSFKHRLVFDPCCGMKAYGNILREDGFTRLLERDKFHMDPPHDFFLEPIPEEVSLIITNPPFRNKGKFMKKCFESGIPFMLLLPTDSLSLVGCNELFQQYGVVVINVFPHPQFLCPDGVWRDVCNTSYFCGNFPKGHRLYAEGKVIIKVEDKRNPSVEPFDMPLLEEELDNAMDELTAGLSHVSMESSEPAFPLTNFYDCLPDEYKREPYNPYYAMHGLKVPYRMLFLGGQGKGKLYKLIKKFKKSI